MSLNVQNQCESEYSMAYLTGGNGSRPCVQNFVLILFTSAFLKGHLLMIISNQQFTGDSIV